MLDHFAYNSLPTIFEADKGFTDRSQLLQKIAPLLAREEYQGKYNLCLVHKHVILQPGEQMVATGLITQPEKFTLSETHNIIPSSWTAAGIPFEWKHVEISREIAATPPPELFREFEAIVGKDSVLGISLAQDPLPEGYIWSEHIDHEQRQHILEIKPVAEPWGDGAKVFETSWTLKHLSGQPSLFLSLACVCLQHFRGPIE